MKKYMVPTAEIIDFEHDYVAASGLSVNGREHTGGGSGQGGGTGANSLLDEINQIDQIGDLH